MVDDCKDCLSGIGRIEATLKILSDNMMKLFYGLIGIIAASIGTKYIGTPLYVYVAVYLAIVSATFVLLLTVAKRACLTFWEKWIRYTFVFMVCYASGLRIYHYQSDSPLTQFEGILANLFYTALAVGFGVIAWQRDALRKDKRRRYDD